MISKTQIIARIINSQTGIDRRIGGIPELKPDIMTLADRTGNPTDLEVKVLVIIVGSVVDAEVVNLIRDSIITVFDMVVRGTVLSGFRMVKTDKPELTHVLYHEIDTGDQGPIVSRPYRYDRVKQRIIDYHIQKIIKEGTIWSIQLTYMSPVLLTRKNNGLLPDFPDVYRFTVDYRKLNAITKYPRYPLPLIDDLITNIPFYDHYVNYRLKIGLLPFSHKS
ncbi:retrovirus-related Pol polyprotein from transposon 17.6 [Trichonephila clavipes]|nr:retrovirus-related Pol polyprotein from transposon 17.6 [Trichonephila clavipes]